mmetsp:Transcript_15916/g.39908  ORF Transcript_15916/g.39908 Transcript_15916/m.39908 type:complete len:278 (+) Transcript_15916:1066-1899(+)
MGPGEYATLQEHLPRQGPQAAQEARALLLAAVEMADADHLRDQRIRHAARDDDCAPGDLWLPAAHYDGRLGHHLRRRHLLRGLQRCRDRKAEGVVLHCRLSTPRNVLPAVERDHRHHLPLPHRDWPRWRPRLRPHRARRDRHQDARRGGRHRDGSLVRRRSLRRLGGHVLRAAGGALAHEYDGGALACDHHHGEGRPRPAQARRVCLRLAVRRAGGPGERRATRATTAAADHRQVAAEQSGARVSAAACASLAHPATLVFCTHTPRTYEQDHKQAHP